MTSKHCRRSWMLFRESWKRSRGRWIECGGMLQQEQNRTVATSISFGMNLPALKQDLRRPGTFVFHSDISDEVNVIFQFLPMLIRKYGVLIVLLWHLAFLVCTVKIFGQNTSHPD
jgi:hypothetical protein